MQKVAESKQKARKSKHKARNKHAKSKQKVSKGCFGEPPQDAKQNSHFEQTLHSLGEPLGAWKKLIRQILKKRPREPRDAWGRIAGGTLGGEPPVPILK